MMDSPPPSTLHQRMTRKEVCFKLLTALFCHSEQGMWLFVKVPSQFYADGMTQLNQVEIETRLNAFFAALDAKAKAHGTQLTNANRRCF